MNARHLMVPGLSFELAERQGLAAAATQSTRLVTSFPCTLAAQEATLLTGTPPGVHGVLFSGESPRVPTRIEEWHAREDLLVQGATAEELRRTVLAAADAVDVLVVSGGPVGTRVARRIEPSPAEPDGFTLRFDDGFALCEPTAPGAKLPEEITAGWLATPGIERVLAPSEESAGAWMAPVDRGWILVAEAGWAFREAHLAFGPAAMPDAALLAFGIPWPKPWPAAVHDWRVAPTVLELAGHDGTGGFDAPLEGARGLQG